MSSLGSPTLTQTTTAVNERALTRISVLSLVGASVEWFDFFLFGTAAALVFPQLFFPTATPFTAVLLSFATFGVGFLARPLGGVVWGHFGDRFGRKKAFLAALWTMAVASVAVGLLPTFHTIGIVAPVALSLLRFVQGLAVGGSWGGAALLATEFAPAHRRGFYGSFPQMGVPVGLLLGVCAYFALSFVMGAEAFLGYGWRIPFIGSVVFVGIALYAKQKLDETPAFTQLQHVAKVKAAAPEGAGRSPVLEALRSHWKHIVLAGLAYTVVNATFYLYVTFLLEYGKSTMKMPIASLLIAIAVGGIVMLALTTPFAALSDRIGRRPVYVAGAVATGLWAFPVFWLANTATLWGYTLSIAGGMVGIAMMYGPLAALFTELFSLKVRYSGASLTYQLGAVLGGAVSPILALSLLRAAGSTAAISLYIIGLSTMAVVCILALRETAGKDISE